MPAPPYSSENDRPNMPISFIFSMVAFGMSSVSSTCWLIGHSSFSTNSRIERRSSLRSSGSSKFRPSGLVAIAMMVPSLSVESIRPLHLRSGELGLALAEEGGHAFLGVVAREYRVDAVGFRFQSRGEALLETG